MEYLYDDGEYFYFMNTENYEQMHLTKDLLGDATNYLIPQLKVTVEFYEGKPISVELPATVDHDRGRNRARTQGRHGFECDQTGQDGNRPCGAGAAVHHRRRKDPRQYRGRHLPGTRLAPWRRPPGLRNRAQREAQLTLLLGKHGSQVEHHPVIFDARNHRGIAAAKSPLDPIRIALQRDQPSGNRLLRRRASADNRPAFDDRSIKLWYS